MNLDGNVRVQQQTPGDDHGLKCQVNWLKTRLWRPTSHTYYVVAGETPVLVHNTNCITDVALGIRDEGLRGFADDPANGYTHFLDNTLEDALANVRSAANDSNVHIHVRLDGFKMSSGAANPTPAQLFDDAVERGKPATGWYTTQKEMAILELAYRTGGLETSRLTFTLGGDDVTSQVLQGSQYLGGGS